MSIMNVWLVLCALIVAACGWDLQSEIRQYAAPFSFCGKENSNSGRADEQRMASGHTMNKLTVWYNSNGGSSSVFTGIKAQFTDGTQSLTRGKENGLMGTLTLAPGELITQCLLWADSGSPTRLVRIEITTSAGQTLFAGREQPSIVVYPLIADVGSGVLAGFSGKFGDQVDGAGFIFYKPLISVSMDNLVYTNAPDNGDTWGFSPVAIDEVVYRPIGTTANWRFAGNLMRHEEHSWSSQTTESYGVKVSVSASFFFLKFEASAEWKKETVTKTSSTIKNDISLEWDMSGTATANSSGIIPPFKCVAKVYTAKLDLRWTANLKMLFTDGTSLSTPTSGSYNNMVYSRVDSACNNI